MHIIVKQNVITQVLAHANRVVEKRLATPVLGCVLLETIDNEHVKITSTNLDITVIDVFPCTVEFSGSYCIPAGLFYDITKKLNSDIVLEKSDNANTISVTSNKASFAIHYVESKEFPPVTSQEILMSFELNANLLKNALNIAKVSMSQDSVRVQLNGVYMHYENEDEQNRLRIVSTDLFRVACVSIPASNDIQNMSPIIISRRAVGELLHMLDSTDSVSVKLQNGQVMFEASLKNNIQSTYVTRLVNGAFPEYKMALDVANDKVMTANTEELVNALDRVSTVISDTSNSIKLSLIENNLTLSSISREYGSATESLDVNFQSSEPLDICFNCKYLLELVKQIDSEQVEISFNSSSSPTIIKPVLNKDKDLTQNIKTEFVIMPVELIHN